MNPFDVDQATWAALRELLDVGIDLAPSEREQWLISLPPEHRPLEPRLRALLKHTRDLPGATFETLPRIETADFAGPAATGEAPGDVIGPYRLMRLLGAGGMGSVWLAERTDGLVDRPVALKLPRVMAERSVLAERFARERRILAALNHPNIARLYDVGLTADGRPFLALEYVEGQRIDEYCTQRALPIADRLALALQTTAAVAYAHAKLIVHRDLKPANILVNAQGEVRLLDFGVAKLLAGDAAPSSAHTEFAGSAMTPEYASPEQVAGEPIGVASDVYSLGVILYELLAGTRPYKVERGARLRLELAILHQEIPPPSAAAASAQLRRALRGDLDTIILKALKKRPEDRYATAHALAEDITRYLTHQPVLAQADSRWYRARKFIVRHRLGVGAGAAVVSALLVGSGVALWQAHEARLQRDSALREKYRADAEAENARRAGRAANAAANLNDFFNADLASGRSATEVEQEIERAVKMVRAQYDDDAFLRVRLLTGLAGRFRELGNFARHRQLVAELQPLARSVGDAESVAIFGCWHARDVSMSGQFDAARKLVGESLEALRNLRPVPTETLSACLADESAIARLAGDSGRAVAAIEEARQVEDQGGLGRTGSHADTLFVLARAYTQAGRFREAVATARQSIELRTTIGEADTPSMNNARGALAIALREGGLPLEALGVLDELLAQNSVRNGSPATVDALEYEEAMTLLRCGRAAEALAALTRARAQSVARGDSTLIRATSIGRILALVQLADLDAAQVRLKETEPLYVKLRADKAYVARLFLFAQTEFALARRQLDAAQASLAEVRTLLEALENPGDPAWRLEHEYAARIALARRDFQAARIEASEALAIAQRLAIDPEASVYIGEALTLRASAYEDLGDRAAARGDARRAIRQLEASAGPHNLMLARARALAL